MSESPAIPPRSQRDFRFFGCCVLALGLHGLLVTLTLTDGVQKSEGQSETLLDAPVLDWLESELPPETSRTDPPTSAVVSDETNSETSDSSAPIVGRAPTAVDEQTQDNEAFVLLAAEPGRETSAPVVRSTDNTTTPRRLSLAQLGIGVGPRFELAPAPVPLGRGKPKPSTAEERLQRSFTQSAAHESQRLGLGITGEVKGALLRATQSAQMTDQGSALFTFTFGEGGELQNTTHSTLNGSASDWARVSALVKSTLQKKPAKLPSGTKGAQLSYAVDYSFVLPSGSKGGDGLKWSLTQSFDVADIGATKQASAKATLKNYQVF